MALILNDLLAFVGPVFAKYGLMGLFLNAFFSSLVPIPTEFAVSVLLAIGEPAVIIFTVLLIGSIAGTYLGYYVGYTGSSFFSKLYGTREQKHEERTQRVINRYGIWIILFVSPWIPIVSDIVPIIAGTKRYNLKNFTIAMVLGKTVKVFAIVYFLSYLLSFLLRFL